MSYITVPAEKVINCCKNYQLWIDIRNCQDASRILAKKAKEKKYIFFGSEIGYQGAMDYYNNITDNFASLNFWACFWNTETDDTVKDLLLLAKNGDPVMLSDKHSFIFNFENCLDFEKVE